MDLDLLDHLGDAMLLTDKLMFLGMCVGVCTHKLKLGGWACHIPLSVLVLYCDTPSSQVS